MKEQIDPYIQTLGRSANTRATYRIALEQYVRITGGDPSPEAYEKFLAAIQHLSPSSRRVKVSAVVGFLDYLDKLSPRIEKINRHAMKHVTVRPVVVKREEIEKIIAYCEKLRGDLMEYRDRAFVLTLADSGLRISELCGLTRGEIDWTNEWVVVTGKRDKTAIVRLSPRSLAALRSYLHARAKLDGTTGRPLASLPLFAQHGKVGKFKKITVDGMRKAIKSRMREAGVDPREIRMHDFRHYFVTMIMVRTGNLKLAKDLARHESTTTTNRYAHYGDNEIDEMYREIFNS